MDILQGETLHMLYSDLISWVSHFDMTLFDTRNTFNNKYLFGLTIFIHFILTKGSIPPNSLHFISSGLQVIIITYITF